MRRPTRSSAVLASLVALTLPVSGCGDTSGPSQPEARFAAEVHAPDPRRIEGEARFVDDLANSAVGTAFAFVQHDAADRVVNSVTFHRLSAEPIAPGTYRVGAEAEERGFFGGMTLDGTGVAGGLSCVATDGELRVAHATLHRAYGTFEFSGNCNAPASNVPVPFEVEGSFNAARGSFDHP